MSTANRSLASMIGALSFVLSSACLEEGQSDLLITDSIRSEQEFPAVQKLDLYSTFSGDSICTGTFVSEDVMLTAAHCLLLKGDDSGDMLPEKIKHNGIEAVSWYFHPLYLRSRNVVDPFDLALVRFQSNTVSTWTRIDATKKAAGTDVELVGYGQREQDGVEGEKYAGCNEIKEVRDDFYFIEGALHNESGETETNCDSTALFGDSGGPLLNEGKIVGTVSGGQPINDRGVERYTRLDLAENRAFLASAEKLGIRIPDLDNAEDNHNQCGPQSATKFAIGQEFEMHFVTRYYEETDEYCIPDISDPMELDSCFEKTNNAFTITDVARSTGGLIEVYGTVEYGNSEATGTLKLLIHPGFAASVGGEVAGIPESYRVQHGEIEQNHDSFPVQFGSMSCSKGLWLLNARDSVTDSYIRNVDFLLKPARSVHKLMQPKKS